MWAASTAPTSETQRRDLYLPYAQELVRRGGAYYCFCTKERLDEARAQAEKEGKTFKYDKHCLHLSPEEVKRRIEAGEPYVIRQNVPTEGKAGFDDLLYGHVEVDCSTLDDNVLIKADGLPTYNFANVVDDHLMAITHVMRGTEYLSSAPKYNLLYEAFGWTPPTYIHLPVVMRDATRKLSKRYGDPSFEDLLDMGYLRDAIINFIALLGWSPRSEREFFTLKELEEVLFDGRGAQQVALHLRHGQTDVVQRPNTCASCPSRSFTNWPGRGWRRCSDPARFDLRRPCRTFAGAHGGAQPHPRHDRLPRRKCRSLTTNLYTHKKMKTNPGDRQTGARGGQTGAGGRQGLGRSRACTTRVMAFIPETGL